MPSATAAFDKALREIAVPALSAHGFKFNGGRTFRHVLADRQSAQIIDFQLGQRSMAGKFTVNLGVFVEGDSSGLSASRANVHDCRFERRTRIGAIIPLRFPRLSYLPWLGFLFGIPDKWWRFSGDPSRTDGAVSAAVDAITTHGIDWFTQVGHNNSFKPNPLRGSA